MFLQDLFDKFNSNINDHQLNVIAKKLTDFTHSNYYTKEMKNAVTRSLKESNNYAQYFTSTKRADQMIQHLSKDKNLSMDNTINMVSLDLMLVLNPIEYTCKYVVLDLTHKNGHVIIEDEHLLDKSNLRQFLLAMLSTINVDTYNNNLIKIQRHTNALIKESLKSVYPKKRLIKELLLDLIINRNNLKIVKDANSKNYPQYIPMLKTIDLLKAVIESKSNSWSFNKDSYLENNLTKHNQLQKSLKIDVGKRHLIRILISQLLAEDRYLDNHGNNSASCDDNTINDYWDLNDDLDSLDRVLRLSDKYWVRDLTKSTDTINYYSPIKNYKKHVYHYHIDQYGHLKLNQHYYMVQV